MYRSLLSRGLCAVVSFTCFGASLAAQVPTPHKPAPEPLRIGITVDGDRVTIAPEVTNPAADSLLATYSITVERLGVSGNRSASTQSSAVALAAHESRVLGRSTSNFGPGDRLLIAAELRSAGGEVLARANVDREL